MTTRVYDAVFQAIRMMSDKVDTDFTDLRTDYTDFSFPGRSCALQEPSTSRKTSV
ncbi:hypothetical protein [Azospirillum largimobile]